MKRYIITFIIAFSSILQLSAKQKPIRVACIGNSITYGSGLQDPKRDSYPSQLQRLLGEAYVVGNFGKPGARLMRQTRMPYFDQPEFQQAMQFKGDVALIHLGINDTDPEAWPNQRDHFVKDYCDLIDSLRTTNPKYRIILAQLTPLSDRHHRFLSGTRDWHAMIQKEIARVAELKSCELISFYPILHNRPDLLPDCIHPNLEGYTLMAHTAYGAITGDYGGLQLPAIYGNGMVLPRKRAFTLTGTANAGEKVIVEIAKQKHTATADNTGKWSVDLKPIAQGGPYILKVRAKSRTIELTDILAGEVWLASGQSNMEFELRQTTTAREDIPQADCPNVRLYDQKALWRTDNVEWKKTALDSINRLQYFAPTEWQHCTPGTAQRFSAIGYRFARELSDSLQCPVGIICNAIGGSGIEAWIDRTTVEWQMPELLRDWTDNDFIQDWVRGRARKNMAKSNNPLQRHPYQPCYLFEAGTEALTALPINGVLWYQGESNAHNMESHERMFRLFINSWRQAWNNPELPFLFVQLSSLNRPSWPWFRDSQRRLADELPNVWMAVSSDCGDSLDVHPRNKRPVGHRLTLQALHNVYDWKKTVPCGPTPAKVSFGRKDVEITMEWGQGMHTSDGQRIRTFEVAHDDGLFYPAEVEVKGKTLRIWNKEVKNPRYVRYGWQPFTRANLVNVNGLPCSTFRIEKQ